MTLNAEQQISHVFSTRSDSQCKEIGSKVDAGRHFFDRFNLCLLQRWKYFPHLQYGMKSEEDDR
eukprot:CAMPEP_0113965000 /NCGR_PEP_ID=MMETSP0011_2-20120614/7494_1 /TAXON_ID=101924 /ORGANISM="Rhodosorus marinus" /LENGTH=63 /DNA_ID=CAMNT_0000977449 /DNA_START=942 /DNA_END=1133 /DNA_ORIENTATION=- /assembly_acc=CAM_ASM_000156